MKISKVILASVILTILGAAYAMLTCGWLFNWVYKLEPTCVWVSSEAMKGNFFIWVNLGQLVLYFFFVLILSRFYCCVPGPCSCCKGAVYGFFVWLIGMLPGMFSTYMFMTVNKIVVLYWTVSGLIWLVLAGSIASWICFRKEDSNSGCHCS
ncbi:MAG: hypothetical protein ABH859_06305 [Pseudomonadota bacterium]